MNKESKLASFNVFLVCFKPCDVRLLHQRILWIGVYDSKRDLQIGREDIIEYRWGNLSEDPSWWLADVNTPKKRERDPTGSRHVIARRELHVAQGPVASDQNSRPARRGGRKRPTALCNWVKDSEDNRVRTSPAECGETSGVTRAFSHPTPAPAPHQSIQSIPWKINPLPKTCIIWEQCYTISINSVNTIQLSW